MNKKTFFRSAILLFLFTVSFLQAQNNQIEARQTKTGFPGSEVNYSFKLDNRTDAEASRTFSISGLPSGFDFQVVSDKTATDQVSIPALQAGTVSLTISIPAVALPGNIPFDIRIEGGDSDIIFPENLLIKPEHSIAVVTADGTVSSLQGKTLEIPVSIRNTGSSSLTGLAVTVDPPYGWEISFPDTGIKTLQANESFDAILRVSVPRKQTPGLKTVNISVSSDKTDAATAEIAVEVKQPLNIIWILAAVIAAGLLMLLVINRKYGRR